MTRFQVEVVLKNHTPGRVPYKVPARSKNEAIQTADRFAALPDVERCWVRDNDRRTIDQDIYHAKQWRP